VPLVLDATAGGASSNSYVSLADAETYFEGRPFASAWNDATDPEKEQALVYATTILERERWAGAKGVSYDAALTQALAWPRRWAPTLEWDAAPQWISEWFFDVGTGYYSDLTVPTPIVRATCELALEILRAGDDDPFAVDTSRDLKRKKIGPIEKEWFEAGDRARGVGIYPIVAALIAPLLRSSLGMTVERV
jgi:hypothetical protein